MREFCIKVASWFNYDLIFEGAGDQEVGIDKKTNKVLIKIDPLNFRPQRLIFYLVMHQRQRKF